MRAIYDLLRVWLVLARVDQDILFMATGHRFATMKWTRRLYSPLATISVVVGILIYLEDIRESVVAFLFVPATIAFVARAVFPDLTNRLLEREIFRCAYHADMKAQGAYVNAKLLMDDLGRDGKFIPVQGDLQRMQESLSNPVLRYLSLKDDARASIGRFFRRLIVRPR